ncbi:hypothetical protein, partial [Mesorhizobium sp. M7A.F.Ca.CA.002.04.1.1]|uniref:hypothetical protein n=1 Tax=Mesorhizobium sp. M7A.F.Ca.CA.002.04.1.1 TaxID=2496681 RepID=UPI0019D42CE0
KDRGAEAEQNGKIPPAIPGEPADRVNKTPVIPHPTASIRLGLVAADRAMQDSRRMTPLAGRRPAACRQIIVFVRLQAPQR